MPKQYEMNITVIIITFDASFALEGYDLGRRIHDGWISWDGPSDGVVWVAHIDDHHLRRVPHRLTHADEFVRFHRQRPEGHTCGLDPHLRQLKLKKKSINMASEWSCFCGCTNLKH